MAEAGGNLFAPLPPAGPDEHLTLLARLPGARIERIVSDGQASPPGFWYEQAHDEWVILLAGQASLRLGSGACLDLAPGDWLHLPAGLRHRVEHTAPRTIWLAVHAAAPTDGPG